MDRQMDNYNTLIAIHLKTDVFRSRKYHMDNGGLMLCDEEESHTESSNERDITYHSRFNDVSAAEQVRDLSLMLLNLLAWWINSVDRESLCGSFAMKTLVTTRSWSPTVKVTWLEGVTTQDLMPVNEKQDERHSTMTHHCPNFLPIAMDLRRGN